MVYNRKSYFVITYWTISFFYGGLFRMNCPALSSDVNPMQSVWDMLQRRVAGRSTPRGRIQQLESYLLHGWERIPQSLIDKRIHNMHRMFCFYQRKSYLMLKHISIRDLKLLFVYIICTYCLPTNIVNKL